jgi:hypothetical protein
MCLYSEICSQKLTKNHLRLLVGAFLYRKLLHKQGVLSALQDGTHSGGVENEARLAATSAHKGEGAINVSGSLGVEGDVGSA